MNSNNSNTTAAATVPSIIWALVSTKTGKVRSFAPTREAARQKKVEGTRVLRYVADFSARA